MPAVADSAALPLPVLAPLSQPVLTRPPQQTERSLCVEPASNALDDDPEVEVGDPAPGLDDTDMIMEQLGEEMDAAESDGVASQFRLGLDALMACDDEGAHA